MQHFVKSKQINPTKLFCKEQPNENCLIVGNKFNPISHRPRVYFGTKLKVLIAYFEEKSNSLHLSIILDQQTCFLNQLNLFLSSLRFDFQSLNIFFSEKRLAI